MEQIDRLKQENEDLRRRLEEAEDTLAAIRSGEVDALVVDGPAGEQIFSLRGTDHVYRFLIEEMSEGAVTLSEDGGVLYANKFVENLLERPLEKIIGAAMEQFVEPSDASSFRALLRQSRKAAASAELGLKTSNGSTVPAYLSANFLHLDHQPIYCITITNLTEQKRNQRVLAEERLSRAIIEQSADAIIVCDDRGIVIRASLAAFNLVGRNCLYEHFDQAFHFTIRPPESEPSEDTPHYEPFTIETAIAGGSLHSCEALLDEAGASARHFLLSTAPLVDTDNRVVGAIVNLADITEKMEFERRLVESEQWLSTTLKSIGDGVIACDLQGRVLLANPVAEALTGWCEENAQGKPIREVFHIIRDDSRTPCESPVDKVLETGQIVDLDNNLVLIARDGTERIVADSGAPIRDANGRTAGVVLVFRDITDKVRMEQDLFRNHKIESLGVLAGGLAHDFNNILTTIMGNLSMAEDLLPRKDDMLFRLIHEADAASTRAQTLTRQLLTFAKGGAPVKETASIAEILTETATFVLRGSRVRCEFLIADDVWPAELDTGQISQVIHNVVINADQAMPDGGVIRIEAENCVVGDSTALPLKPGRYIHISIADQGTGIAEKLLPRVFDPYFTTKQKGSGLGLATSHSIIRKHDGHITVDSEAGGGTTFHIYLPASHEPVSEREADRRVKGQGRVLVMDDEQSIRELLGRMLEKLGYQSAAAENGVDAIRMAKEAHEAGEPFDAAILDLTVPGGMGGKETVLRLLEIDPGLKAVVSSGYSDDAVLSNHREYGFSGVLPKPFQTASLSRVLHEVLAGDPK